MTFDTIAVGALVPAGPWRGTVVSVFDKAVNTILPEGVIVSLVSDRFSMHPHGFLVGENVLEALRDSLHEPVARYEGVLRYGADIELQFATAARWSGCVSACSENINPEELAGFLGSSIASSVGAGFGALVTGRGLDRFSKKAASVLQGALLSAGSIDISGLVGLGIGLTPSGDDFITGVLLGECIFGNRVLDRSSLAARLSTTNPPGRTLLVAAMGNEFPAYLLELARELCKSALLVGTVSAAVINAARNGATSGLDACTGLWWYLKTVL